MPQVQLRRAEQILQNMLSLVVARSELSDVVDTAGFKKVLAAVARELDEAYYQLSRFTDLFDLQKAVGEDLDERAKEIQPGTLKRILARRAVGTAVFSRNTTVGDVIIPAGTVLQTADKKTFQTTLQGVVLNGQNDSVLIPITATEAGGAGNVPADTIIKFGSRIPGIDSVTNPTATTQGRDKESDDSFRNRIKNFIASLARGTPAALEFAAQGLEDTASGKQVIFAHVFEDPVDRGNVVVYIDDGAGTAQELGTPVVDENLCEGLVGPPADSAVGGEEFLQLDQFPVDLFGSTFEIESSTRGVLTFGTHYHVNPASGRVFFDPPLSAAEVIEADYTPFAGLIPIVQRVIDGDKNDRLNFPGFRAAGTLVRVLSPVVVSAAVEAALVLADGIDRPAAIAEAELAVQNYINNLGISGDIIRHELIERLMGISGVIDVDLVVPSSNITILDDQISRITSGNINIT